MSLEKKLLELQKELEEATDKSEIDSLLEQIVEIKVKLMKGEDEWDSAPFAD